MIIGDLQSSTSSALYERSDNAFQHFRWESIKKFIFLAFTYSSTSYNFDVFSKVLHDRVKIMELIFFEITIGMTYMFMDVFIRQYTRKIDCNQSLNPLLKGITFGCLLQSLMWNIILAADLADTARFLVAGLDGTPPWSICQKVTRDVVCLPTSTIILRCRKNFTTNLNITSAHVNYQASFYSPDRSDITVRLFVIALVWIFNFFIATVTDTSLVKLFRIASLWRMVSTVFVLIFMLLSTEYFFSTAISQIFDVTAPRVYASSVDHITFAFGVGLVGVYDFGTMSAYTMIDNAVVIFAIVFTTLALARSIIVRVLYLALSTCIKVEMAINHHYLLFVVLPLSSEFLHTQKIFTSYIYVNVMFSLVAYLAMLTLTISKLLHSEFRSVKNVYMVGLLCFLGCNLSFPIAMNVDGKKSDGDAVLVLGCARYGFIDAINVVICLRLAMEQNNSSPCRFEINAKVDKGIRTGRVAGRIVLVCGASWIANPFKCYATPCVLHRNITLPKNKLMGLLQGMNLTVLYLGGFKVAVVMWLYGVERFSTDIQFSLGFKPTLFWKFCWSILPVIIFMFIVHKIYILVNMTETFQMIVATTWVVLSLLLVITIQTKTVTKYMVQNNLVGVFKCSQKYGPPDREDRLRRRKFEIALLHRQCIHDCIVIDEATQNAFIMSKSPELLLEGINDIKSYLVMAEMKEKSDCNHLPLIFKNKSKSEPKWDTSLTNIFEAGPSTKKTSAVLDISQMHID